MWCMSMRVLCILSHIILDNMYDTRKSP